MGRRRESLMDVLIVLPWWVSSALAVVAYLLLTYAAPAYFSANPFTVGIGQGFAQLRPLVCGMFLVLALASFIRSRFIARKFGRQQSIEDIRALSWRQFESVVGEAFRRRGYTVVENAADGPDGGVDLVLQERREVLCAMQAVEEKQRRREANSRAVRCHQRAPGNGRLLRMFWYVHGGGQGLCEAVWDRTDRRF